MKRIIKITTEEGQVVKKGSIGSGSAGPVARAKRSRLLVWVLAGILILAIGLGVGLGVGLTRSKKNTDSNDSSDTNLDNGDTTSDETESPRNDSSLVITATKSTSSSASSRPTQTYKTRASQTFSADYWQPTAGETWEITLIKQPSNTDLEVGAYDIDLFDNSMAYIANLKLKGYKIICYFSAGSYEDWRSDAKKFSHQDYGEAMDGWAGEWWLDIMSPKVRKIMSDRIVLAQEKGCDAIDPDNINGYQNPTGFNQTTDDAIDFVKFLANEAHSHGMAMGLKNGGAMVKDVIDYTDFCVQESCVAWDECEPYRLFLEYNSPVFHLEYPDESNMTIAQICDPDNGAQGFSTLIKHLNLDDWTETCPS